MATPPRKTASDFDPEVLKLFDQYVHGVIDRRGFLSGAARFAVGATTAAGLLAALSPQFAAAQQIKPDDKRLDAKHIEFDSPQGYGKGRGYLVRPAKARGPLPTVLVIHENRGLNPHIEDVTRRLALENYIAFAPDALFPLGGYPGDEDKARAEFAKLDQAKTRQDLLAAARMLKSVDGGNGRLGVIGFCYGGGMSNFLATQLPDLAAAAPFYGPAPAVEDVSKIKARMLVVLAANDERVNAGWPAYEEALKKAGVRYELYQPAGTQHGFHNDTTPRYDEAAAKEAWKRSLALFEETLREKSGAGKRAG
ncbi:dienelactone hydrolase family protein [Lysobacter sp.]|uniref:dienelactone hydrolase family protein n=1 Tax=Lysobacter sp. TaxID=72226 RepID=UPI002D661050|nr:dienelactone hydrolase family protein [Lysobacter sp.]HZX77999.1 dienelactone hydrolase family protein [Lysobacter sp.]